MEIRNWEDVDMGLKRLGEIEVTIEIIEGDLTQDVSAAKDRAKDRAKNIVQERTDIEKSIKDFVELNKAEFAKKRTKTLMFGEIGVRVVKSVSIPRGAEKLAALVKSLIAYGHNDCVKTKQEPDRDAIAELTDDDLARLGLKRTTRDSLRIVPNIERIKEISA